MKYTLVNLLGLVAVIIVGFATILLLLMNVGYLRYDAVEVTERSHMFYVDPITGRIEATPIQ